MRFLPPQGTQQNKRVNVFELTRELIDIPSLTGDELAVGKYLAGYLEQLGYHVERQEVAADRYNVIATTRESPRVVFSTHMDTVPPFIASSEDEEFIYGRGSCDAKGIIAAQIFASERLRAEGVNDIGLLFTVDEELSSIGAKAANKHALARECRYLINGEPTDNRLATGSKGAVQVIVSTEGRAGHSAYPETGESAIEKLLDVLDAIRRCEWPEDSYFGATTCNIGVIEGGTRPNVIADKARAQLQMRLGVAVEQVKKVLEDVVGARGRVEYNSACDPMRLLAVPGFEQCIVRFGTDIPYLPAWGQALLLGPGSILGAHTAHERISKRELNEAVELYVDLAKRLTL